MLTEELEAKLPKFVPEHQRYVCGAPGCSYLTCDETMLRYHLRALHFDEPYRWVLRILFFVLVTAFT
jgi:hypothetical protein